MVHPFNKELAMENETPQTEREWRILFISELGKLSTSVEHLTMVVRDFKENEIAELRREISDLKSWKTEVMSSWKTIVAICVLIGGVLGVIVKALF